MTEFIKKVAESIDQYVGESKIFDVPQKNIEQILKYLKHDILISLYRKEPEVPGNEEKMKFNVELNKKIEDLYYKQFQAPFNQELHLKNKQRPLFLMGMPGDGKRNAYQIAAKEVCENLGLTLVTDLDLSDDYIPKQTDFIMLIKEENLYNTNFEDAKKWNVSNPTDMKQIFSDSDFKDISKWDMSNIQKLEKIAEGVKIQKKSHELNAEDAKKWDMSNVKDVKKSNMQDYCAGMMFVIDDVKNIEMAMITSSNYNKNENIYVGFTGNLEQLTNKYNLSDTLTDAVIPIVVNNSLDNENVENVALNKTTISQNVKETLANFKAPQENNKIKNNM